MEPLRAAVTGQYVLSLVNGSDIRIRNDENGNLIGYFINNTAGSQIVQSNTIHKCYCKYTGPHVTCVNLTLAAGFTSSQFAANVNTVRAFNVRVTCGMWRCQLPSTMSLLTPSLVKCNNWQRIGLHRRETLVPDKKATLA